MFSLIVIQLLSMLLPLVLGDFEIATSNECYVDDTSVDFFNCFSYNVACPEDKWNCDCLTRLTYWGKTWADSEDLIHVAGGSQGDFCGAEQLDLYRITPGDASSDWTLFIAGGDGTPVGNCWPTRNWNKLCILGGPSFDYAETLYCETYWCT